MTGTWAGEGVPVGRVVAVDVRDAVAEAIGVGVGGQVAVGAEVVAVEVGVGPSSSGSPGEDGVDGDHALGEGDVVPLGSGERRSGLVDTVVPVCVRRGKTPSSSRRAER